MRIDVSQKNIEQDPRLRVIDGNIYRENQNAKVNLVCWRVDRQDGMINYHLEPHNVELDIKGLFPLRLFGLPSCPRRTSAGDRHVYCFLSG
jgi:hypothetical protein